MSVSKYRKKQVLQLKKKALALYKRGLALRQIQDIVGKSHEWVRLAIKELTKLDRKKK